MPVEQPKAYKIVAEEPQFLVVSKSPGINIHNERLSPGKSDEFSQDSSEMGLVNLLREDFQRDDLLPVHRLDKATSGLLLIGKGSESTSELSKLFQRKEVIKFYWAIAEGKPNKKQGKVKGDIVKNRGGSYRLSKTCDSPSLTQFQSYSLAPGIRAYLLKPLTGKTHQLRVVMKSLGVPILGDERYGNKTQKHRYDFENSINRMCLHATAIRFFAFGKWYQYEDTPQFNLEIDGAILELINSLCSVFDQSFPGN